MSDLLTPATPDLLDGWCGPVVFAGHAAPCVVLAYHVGAGDGPSVDLWHTGLRKEFRTSLDAVELDLSRAECRDRAARVLAARVGIPSAVTTAPEWCGDEDGWSMITGDLREPVNSGMACWDRAGNGFAAASGRVPALAALDPNDDTRLPDGSRSVDAHALRLCLEATRG